MIIVTMAAVNMTVRILMIMMIDYNDHSTNDMAG